MSKLNTMTPVAALLALSVAGMTQIAMAANKTATEVHPTKVSDAKCGEAKCGANQVKKQTKTSEAKCGSDKKVIDAKCGGK